MKNTNPNEENCVSPEIPYCQGCDYGFIEYDEEYLPGEPIFVKEHCTYPKFLESLN